MNYLINKMLRSFEDNLDKKDIQYYYFGKPWSLPKGVLDKGVLIVHPIETNVSAVTSGITDQETMSVRIIVAKNVQDEFINNAQRETGVGYLSRVFENKSDTNQLQANTVRYVIRNNFRTWGIMQEVDLNFEYDTNELDNIAEGAVTGGVNLTVIDHFAQPIL